MADTASSKAATQPDPQQLMLTLLSAMVQHLGNHPQLLALLEQLASALGQTNA